MSLPSSDSLLTELQSCTNEEDLKQFFQTYLGKKGSINGLFKTLKDASPEERKTKGQQIKKLSETIQSAFFAKQDEIKKEYWDNKLKSELIDLSFPAPHTDGGTINLQNKLRRKVENLFARMGFAIEYGHKVVTQYENFTSVNIPPTHPATEMHDTLHIKDTNKNGEKLVMRTHTSAHQNALIKKYGPSCRFIVPGKVFRYEDLDATHDYAFWQVEGVVIDKNISIAHFKSMMKTILSEILEDETLELRMRPGYFPFVEPGFEIDAKYKMKGKDKRLEILGAGMIHSSVLEQAGVDTNEYSGFAFGLGMTRLVAIKNNLHDVRLLTNGDLRFHKTV